MTAPHRPTPSLLDELQDRLILPGMLRFTKLGYAWRKRSSLVATQTPPPMATSNSPTLTVLR